MFGTRQLMTTPPKVFHCVQFENAGGTAVESTIDNFVSVVGKGVHSVSMWGGDDGSSNSLFASILSTDATNGLSQVVSSGRIKMVTLMWQVNSATDLSNYASGAEDTKITNVANAVKAVKYPVFIRWGWEMNINQGGSGSAAGAGWASSPSTYISAFQRVYTKFQTAGVTNAQFCFNPGDEWSGWNSTYHATDFYPGDAYCDWIGVDMYQAANNAGYSDPGTSFVSIFSHFTTNKPWAVFEWGVNAHQWSGSDTPDATQAAWINGFFDGIEGTYRNVRLICYQYVTDSGLPAYNAFTSSTFPLATAAYQTRISNPRYM